MKDYKVKMAIHIEDSGEVLDHSDVVFIKASDLQEAESRAIKFMNDASEQTLALREQNKNCRILIDISSIEECL